MASISEEKEVQQSTYPDLDHGWVVIKWQTGNVSLLSMYSSQMIQNNIALIEMGCRKFRLNDAQNNVTLRKSTVIVTGYWYSGNN